MKSAPLRKQKSYTSRPWLLASFGDGRVFEIPELEMTAMTLNQVIRPEPDTLIPMPPGSALFELPDRKPIGWDPLKEKNTVVDNYRGRSVCAVATFMAPAYSQIYRAAYQSAENAPTLPLFAYTAAGWMAGAFHATGVRVDADIRQDLAQFDDSRIEQGAQQMLKKYPNNRLVAHLVEHCVRSYHCPAAQNFVLGRWEAPVPTSPSCNARCLGCISKQPPQGVPVTQDRLTFTPTVDEIVAFAVPHLENAARAIISFGQGCEGEPLLQGKMLEETIRAIRRRTDKGTINLNTNACYPEVVEKLCQAGLDSIRVSLNSAQKSLYQAYYSPKDYGFADVLTSMRVIRSHHRWISLNYFIFPGLTDHPAEMEPLQRIIQDYRVDYIQMRNLNIDPEWYIRELNLTSLQGSGMGIKRWMQEIKAHADWIRFGYFNPPKEDFGDSIA